MTSNRLRYGLLGMPLAFAALPLVVQWPAHAAASMQLPLALLGILLLAVRAFDALVDPLIGRWADQWFERSANAPHWALASAAIALAVGFAALFAPPPSWALPPRLAPEPTLLAQSTTIIWATVALLLTYTGYSVAQVVHQAWAARMGGSATARANWVGARETFALAGVMLASVLPTFAGWPVTILVLALLLAAGLSALQGLPTRYPPADARPGECLPGVQQRQPPQADVRAPDVSPWGVRGFRSLMAVHVLNGLAAAIPASLVLFFVRDRIQAPAAFEAGFLAAYFGAAAIAVPLWVRAVSRLGLVKTWVAGMVLSVLAFTGAAFVGQGQVGAFMLICVASGLALGADLVVPAALLAGVVQQSGLQGQAEGRWFGWWSLASKLTLALAAGLALPLVQALGYQPGERDANALTALGMVYALLPCGLKLLAAVALWWRRGDWEQGIRVDEPISSEPSRSDSSRPTSGTAPPSSGISLPESP
jgi:Na+/melibiose symporter-like transporter